MPEETKEIDSGLRCLMTKLKVLSIPFSVENLKHRVGDKERLDKEDILFLAKDHLKLKAMEKTVSASKLKDYVFPVIAERADGHFNLLLKADDGKLYYQDPLSAKTETIGLEEFNTTFTGSVILISDKKIKKEGDDFSEFGLLWFVKAFFKYKFTSTQVIIASVIMQIFILVTPLFTMIIIDKVFTAGKRSTLDVLIIALAIITVFEFAITQTRAYLLHHNSNKIDLYTMSKLFSHLLSLPLTFFTGKQTGDTISRLKEVESIRNFITGSALTTVIDFPFSILLLIVMFYFSTQLAIIVCASIVLIILIYAVVGPIMKKRMQKNQKDSSDTQSFLYEIVASIETVKSMSAETRMQKSWEEQLVNNAENNSKAEMLNHKLSSIASFLNKSTVAVCLWMGAVAVMAKPPEMTAGQLIAFNMLVGRVMGPAQRIAQIFQQLQQVQVSAKRVKEIFETKPEPALHSNMISLPKMKGEVKFDELSFKYNSDLPLTLEEINFTVPAGQVVGIIGLSGSGKSTMMKLLQRLHAPTEGRILIDGINIAEINPVWFRRNIGVVLQDNILLNRSIRENIALANPSLTMEQIEQASVLAGADEFIRKMPQVYDTVVGERGAMLSAGQRQRIAIARALVNNPRILIFDEATSALDYESEQIIQNNMARICAGRTVFIVAHRFSTLRIVQRVLTVEEGRIIEDGTIQELLKKNSTFARLFKLQNINYKLINPDENKKKA